MENHIKMDDLGVPIFWKHPYGKISEILNVPEYDNMHPNQKCHTVIS